MTLEHAAFPHMASIEWQALHRLAAVSGEVVVTSLLSSRRPTNSAYPSKSSWIASSPKQSGECQLPRTRPRTTM
ncbi:hypothetical protein PF005_g27293 [Phytophthora fragariae]|uniref:Uncharacterized protein n=1 Tax=Phytophthora fragariae TaxID=53985 RepID=A0A6A3PZM1_9STRA|nr:hypothetical protein PF003_g2097 [Phytophthora fragariae]KAE8921578.1 hypothetical protein PF009_g28144 [Phytophthora fragariae]KAE8968629.1 hypothetical protein PF011_g27109 [Phytophthora fragariae]KAE9065918.1 hypothetical protein PF007_g28676 [Phytophthora fragariae]KAE9072145.1 hypothetical protein PF010_g25604 [Phytophthora fragariae]